MNDSRTLEALARSTTALRLLRNPSAGATLAGSHSQTFRMPVYVDELTVEVPPTDDKGNVLPYVVLLDIINGIDVATWPNVTVDKTRKLPPKSDISIMVLIGTYNATVWQAVRQSIIDGTDNGEPGNAGNGNGRT